MSDYTGWLCGTTEFEEEHERQSPAAKHCYKCAIEREHPVHGNGVENWEDLHLWQEGGRFGSNTSH